MAAADGLFEPFVMEVASACAEAGFPDYASELVDAVVGLGRERLSSLLASSGPPLRTSPVDVRTTEALADLLGRDVDCVTANGVVLPFSDADVSFVAVSSEDDAWFHGMRLTSVPGSPVVVDLRRIEAEALLYRCQSSIVGGLVPVRGREALEASGFARVIGCTMVPSPSVDDVLADFGLRKGRLDQSRDLIRAVMAARGRFRGVSPCYRVDMDLRRKGSRITAMEADNPFRSAFFKVEFDPCITDERFGCMSDGFSRIADAGYVQLATFEDVVGLNLCDGIIVRNDVLEDRRDEIVLYVQCVQRALDELGNDPQLRFEYLKQFYADRGQVIEDSVLQRLSDDTIYMTTEVVTADDYRFAEQWGPITEFLIENGRVDDSGRDNVAKNIDETILADALGCEIKK